MICRQTVQVSGRAALDRRAFAMPLVVLLAFVASLALVVLLERRAVSQRIAARQIANYTGHHRAAGLKEIINRWLSTTRNRIGESISAGGRAFSMELPSGEVIEVSFSDGQGAAMIDDSAFSGDRRDLIRAMRDYLQSLPPALTEGATRSVGPAEISLQAAPAIVIEALVVATVEPPRVPRALEAILTRRNAGLLQRDRLPEALTDAGLNEDERDELLSMLVESPTLWRVQADIVDRSGRTVSRSVGLMEWSAESRSDAFNQSGPFLTWEEVPVEALGFERPAVGVPSLPYGPVR